MGLFAGSCGLIISFIRDVSNDLEFLNIDSKSNQSDEKIRLNRLIQQHSDVKRLKEFAWSSSEFC